MKNLLYCISIVAFSTSCTETNQNETNRNENGRYIPIAISGVPLRILDTQTGRVYFEDKRGSAEPGTMVYKDYIYGSTPYQFTNPDEPE